MNKLHFCLGFIVEILKRIYYFLVHTNLLIALAAIAQCALTYMILQLPINPAILIVEGTTTLLLYNLSLYLSLPRETEKSPYVRTRWIGRNMPVFWGLSLLAFIICLFALWQLHLITWVFLGVIGLISIAYAVPLFKFKGKRLGLRQVPGLKVFYIAVIWSLSSVGLPVLELYANGEAINWYMANYLGIVKILFLLLCTLPFDIRDYEQDVQYNLKTLPILMGKKKAIGLSYAMGVIHILLISLSPYSDPAKTGMVLTSLLVLLLFKALIFTTKKHYHHVYLLDLALIVQWLIVWICLSWRIS